MAIDESISFHCNSLRDYFFALLLEIRNYFHLHGFFVLQGSSWDFSFFLQGSFFLTAGTLAGLPQGFPLSFFLQGSFDDLFSFSLSFFLQGSLAALSQGFFRSVFLQGFLCLSHFSQSVPQSPLQLTRVASYAWGKTHTTQDFQSTRLTDVQIFFQPRHAEVNKKLAKVYYDFESCIMRALEYVRLKLFPR